MDPSNRKRCSILALDLETTIRSNTYMSANPNDPENSIVMMGHQKIYPGKGSSGIGEVVLSLPTHMKKPDFVRWHDTFPLTYKDQQNLHSIRNMCEAGQAALPPTTPSSLVLDRLNMSMAVYNEVTSNGFTIDELFEDVHTIVGQNINFDILYLLRMYGDRFRKHLDHMSIWDLQTGEYLLSGQLKKYANLDEVLKRIGKSKREADLMKTYWNAGVGTERIPFYQLSVYLKGDVENLYWCMRRQIVDAKDKGMLPFIRDQMESTWSLAQISCEGLFVHRPTLEALNNEYQLKLNTTALEVRHLVLRRACPTIPLGVPTADDIALWNQRMRSRSFWSNLLVYHEIKTEKDGWLKVPGLYHPKYGATPLQHIVHPKLLTVGKDNIVSLDAAILEDLGGCPEPNTAKYCATRLAKLLLKYRDYAKRLSTYVIPIGDNMLPVPHRHVWKYFPKHTGRDMQDWAVLYPNYSDVGTATGRLTSSKPNMLNLANNEVKKVFKMPPGWQLIEWDFKQIEVIVLALLCRDPTLTKLLVSGGDVHTFLFEALYLRAPTKEERKKFKRASFGLIYGSGALGLVDSTGMTIKEVRAFIKNWKKLFPESEGYANDIKTALKSAPIVDYSAAGDVIKQWQSPTKRILSFTTMPSTTSKGPTDFNWPQLKNYPIQSVATADIVKNQVAKLVRNTRNDPELSEMSVVCTIHDNAGMYIPRLDNGTGFSAKYYKAPRVLSDVKSYLTRMGISSHGLPFHVEGTVYEETWAEATYELDHTGYAVNTAPEEEPAVEVDEEDL